MINIKVLAFLFLFLITVDLATANIVLRPEKINATSGILDWKSEIDAKGRELVKSGHDSYEGLTECRETEELAGVILCLSFFQADMNKIFGRISIFAEGGYDVPKGSIVTFDNSDLLKLNRTTQGNDIPSPLLFAFAQAVKDRCHSDKCKMNSIEKNFYKNIVTPVSKQHAEFVVLGFSHQSFDSYQINVGHEMLHAQFFVSKSFRDAIEVFWNNHVPDQDKEKIRSALADEGYDPKDETLIRNEFQAFILELGAETSRLKEFVPLYRRPLIDELTKNGVQPIHVH